MVTVKVMGDCVVIDLKKKRSKHEKMLRLARCSQSEWLQPEIAAAVTKWANGSEASTHLKNDFKMSANVDATPCRALQPFRNAMPEMVIYEDRISLCGANIWRECTQLYTRNALAMLSRKDKNGFVRIKGTKLTKDLGCPASNQIGAHFSRFCQRAVSVMRDKGLDCGREDIIQNFAGGYHFREWMSVRVVGAWAAQFGVPIMGETQQPNELGPDSSISLNERQQWVLNQVDSGARITMKDVAAHFRNQLDRSTIGRDLKDLRKRGLLSTHPHGHYIRVRPAQ